MADKVINGDVLINGSLSVTDIQGDGSGLTGINFDGIPVATTSQNGLLSAEDKQLLDNFNPNISKTISDINSTKFDIINAKQENTLSLVMGADPVISALIRTSNLLDVNDTYGSYYIGSTGTINQSNPDILGSFIPVTPGLVIYYTGHVGDTTASSVNRRLHVYTSNQTWIRLLNAATNLRVGQDWSTYGTVPANGAYIRVSWGVTDTNVMISVGAPAKYEPYYITPFAPITSINFKVSPTSDIEDATTYTFNVPSSLGDQYGFKFDPIAGKLWEMTGHIASYNGETLPSYWQSDRDVYAEGTTPSIGAEVIYLLNDEDIIEHDITPMVIPLNYHVNYFFIENGTFQEFTYYAETFAVDHLTIHTGLSFGNINVLLGDMAAWSHAADLIDTKADLESPAFTGSPTAPTPGVSANSTRLATTQFVQNKMANLAPIEVASKATADYSVGLYLMLNGLLCKVTAAIAKNTTITLGTNVQATDVATELTLLFSLIQ